MEGRWRGMEPNDALLEATTIAREAFAKARDIEIEANVREFEKSDVPVLRSLAQTYRMLRRPFF